jgi:hypothetical protein
MIKLIASDLDDTLLNNDYKISERDKETIKKLKGKGIYFTIATGRVTYSVRKFAQELGVEVPYISFNGAKITDPKNDNMVFSRELEKHRIKNILEYAEDRGIHCNVYSDEKIFIKNNTKWSEYYNTFSQHQNVEEVGSLIEFEFKETPKILLLDEHEVLKNALDEIKDFVDKDINIYFSKPNFLEFTHKQASKGDALKHIAELLGIKRNEVAAIGDSFNDESMIKYAGLSAVVGNGRDELKKIADFVSATNDESGFSDFVESKILK